ncbi:MAG: alpha-hydroxy acid oxidase [Hyphomicrobiales bacterium]
MNQRFSSRVAGAAPEPIAPADAPDIAIGPLTKLMAGHAGHLRSAAKRRLPRAIFDFVEGGSNDEMTLRANRTDFEAVRLNQRVFDHPASRNMHTTIFGQHATIPAALAPIGLSGVIYPRGEIHAARAAHAFGVPYCLSTLASTSIEQVAAAVRAPFLFQLYLMKDRAVNAALLQRADQARCPAVVVTLDTAVQGRRNRDLDNGLVVPLKVRLRHVIGIASRPRWLAGWLLNKPTLANLAPYAGEKTDLASVSAWTERHFKGAVTPADLDWVRHTWPRKLVVKGILNAEDAKRAVEVGADAIVVSNHGGRQLDGTSSTVRAFPAIRDAVGDKVELILDSGVRTGFDILKAMGLGASGCLVGRAFVYGMASHGEAGVTTALKLLAQELDEAMTLTGTADVNALPKGLVLTP